LKAVADSGRVTKDLYEGEAALSSEVIFGYDTGRKWRESLTRAAVV
jgi:hypothetical protein